MFDNTICKPRTTYLTRIKCFKQRNIGENASVRQTKGFWIIVVVDTEQKRVNEKEKYYQDNLVPAI